MAHGLQFTCFLVNLSEVSQPDGKMSLASRPQGSDISDTRGTNKLETMYSFPTWRVFLELRIRHRQSSTVVIFCYVIARK